MGLPDEGTRHPKIAGDDAYRARLHEDVADRGSFDGSGQDVQPAGVGRELTQQRVASPAADDVYDVDLPSGQFTCSAQRRPIGEREAVYDAPSKLGRCGGRRLVRLPARRGDAL